MASHATHRLIHRLFRQPELIQRLQKDPDGLFSEYGIDAKEQAVLRNPSPEALAGIEVHPILQIHLLLALNPQFAAGFNVGPYIVERLKKGA